MKIALCQLDTTVGAFARNCAAIERLAARAAGAGAELALFPELAVCGYPPKDFLLLPDFVAREVAALEALARSAVFARVAAVVGYAEPHSGPGAGVYNSAALLAGGRVVASGRKTLLPTYDVFDEGRYFDAAPGPTLVDVGGVRVALTICEDVWNDKLFWPHRRYASDPVERAVAEGAELVVNVSASPYAMGKPALRRKMLAHSARANGVPLAYVNLVGGNDSLVFDGGSMAFGPDGTVLAEAASFREDFQVVDVKPCRVPRSGPSRPDATLPLAPPASELTPPDLEGLFEALVLGTRDYAKKTGFSGAVLGLSGGIDSALTACIAAQAFGPNRVTGVAMPSRYTAAMSNDDARTLAGNLGIGFETIPIEPMVGAFLAQLASAFAGKPRDVTEENLQARVRGSLLMALSHQFGTLLLSTGNKSELGTGYCTLYGDMAGGLAVIGDLPKTVVWALSRWVNRAREVIPARTIERPPTAELRENQTDQDSLPPYDVLDTVLRAYTEEHLTFEEIVRKGVPAETVRRVLGLVVRSEYKRRQAAPTLKVTARAFGEGWRFPIAHGYGYCRPAVVGYCRPAGVGY